MPENAKPPDMAALSLPETLAALHVNVDTGLTKAEVDALRKEQGYNEVAETKGHLVLKFIRKFWGISAWMLELTIVLSAVLGKYSDLVVVSALLVVNAVLSFMQEKRAAGVVTTFDHPRNRRRGTSGASLPYRRCWALQCSWKCSCSPSVLA